MARSTRKKLSTTSSRVPWQSARQASWLPWSGALDQGSLGQDSSGIEEISLIERKPIGRHPTGS